MMFYLANYFLISRIRSKTYMLSITALLKHKKNINAISPKTFFISCFFADSDANQKLKSKSNQDYELKIGPSFIARLKHGFSREKRNVVRVGRFDRFNIAFLDLFGRIT